DLSCVRRWWSEVARFRARQRAREFNGVNTRDAMARVGESVWHRSESPPHPHPLPPHGGGGGSLERRRSQPLPLPPSRERRPPERLARFGVQREAGRVGSYMLTTASTFPSGSLNHAARMSPATWTSPSSFVPGKS